MISLALLSLFLKESFLHSESRSRCFGFLPGGISSYSLERLVRLCRWLQTGGICTVLRRSVLTKVSLVRPTIKHCIAMHLHTRTSKENNLQDKECGDDFSSEPITIGVSTW